MRLHVVGLAFSETTREWEHCAFSARTRVFATMMTERGYDVRLYAGENNDALVTEHIPLVTRAEQAAWWPDHDRDKVFNDFDADSEAWMTFNARAILAIRERCEPGDILCLTMGWTQHHVASAFPELHAVETGIGYPGVFAPFRVFESWAWRNYLQSKNESDDVRFFDEVIPRAYEVDDFPSGDGSGGYVLFIGRLMQRKGPHIAAMAAQRCGVPLVVAGQGAAEVTAERITCEDGTLLEGEVSYAGVLSIEDRAEVMGNAIATFVPTIYLEPFGGVSVESQLCGTPAIVSPSGGLPENVMEGRTGNVCSTLSDFADAIATCAGMDRAAIRDNAQDTWGTEAIADRFDAYFRRLQMLEGAGWYA